MNRDTIVLGVLTALNLVAVTLTSMVSSDVPAVLAASLTTLIGATAGVAYTSSHAASTGNANGPA